MQAYRWIIDSRDEYQEERLEKLSGQKLERCYQIGACSLTCPKGLDPRDSIEKLKDLYSDYKKKKRSYLSI
jgi:succinate dehydrogenase (ubiquinone) iron-sulfur subunit